MKSIIEEASSISKAIEKAWIHAGKPREFSIKVFEEAKVSFLGFTKQSAKIALMFDEKKITIRSEEKTKEGRFKVKKTKKPVRAKEYEEKTLWTDEMVSVVNKWIKTNLRLIGLPNINFTTSIQKYHLRFRFETSVLKNKEKEKILFSTFAHLTMATLRNKFKKEFRGLKVVLSSN